MQCGNDTPSDAQTSRRSTPDLRATRGSRRASGRERGSRPPLADQPGCDEVGDRLLAALRRDVSEPPPRFAAGFTSVMAGAMLAAETIKHLLGQPVSPHIPAASNVTFQFLKPVSSRQ